MGSPIPLYQPQMPNSASGMILHGFAGSSDSMLEMASHLHFDTIIPDLIGHGKSPCPEELKHYTLDAMVGQIHVVAEVSFEESFDLIGYSMGARLAIEYALEHQDKLRALILIGGTPGIDDDAARHERALEDVEKIAFLEDKGLEQFINFWESQQIFASQRYLSPETQMRQRRTRLSTKPFALASHLRASGTGVMISRWSRLNELKIPVLLIVGSEDKKYIEIGRQMQSTISSSCLSIINSAGHATHLEQPANTAKAIDKFIEGLTNEN